MNAYTVNIVYFDYIYTHHNRNTMPTSRSYTKTTVEATRLLGQLIKLARKKKRMSEHELATRANISRSTVQKIEKGDPSINIGLAFEAAAVIGVPLFNTENLSSLKTLNEAQSEKLALLVHKSGRDTSDLKDNF